MELAKFQTTNLVYCEFECKESKMEMLKERHRQYGGQCNVMLSGEAKYLRGKTFNMVFLFCQCLLWYKKREVGVLNPHLLDLLIKKILFVTFTTIEFSYKTLNPKPSWMLLVTKAISLNRIQIMQPILWKKPYAFFLYTRVIYRGEIIQDWKTNCCPKKFNILAHTNGGYLNGLPNSIRPRPENVTPRHIIVLNHFSSNNQLYSFNQRKLSVSSESKTLPLRVSKP